MANRTMLVAASKIPAHKSDADIETMSLGEFAYDVPLMFQLLVSKNPVLCHSVVFEHDSKLAIAGDAKAALKELAAIHAALPVTAQNKPLLEDALDYLTKEFRDYPYFLLEPAEVFDMDPAPLDQQMADLLKTLQTLDIDAVRKAAAGQQDFSAWAADCWTHVTYFIPRGAVEPPKDLTQTYMSMHTGEAMEHLEALANHTSLENLRLDIVPDDPYLDDVLKALARNPAPFHLSLGGQAKTLPDSIGLLTCIEGLSLNKLGLETLPHTFSNLTQITKFAAVQNAFTEMPAPLRDMPWLEFINLSDNQITQLPEWIGSFTQLTDLNVHKNPISKLPDGFWQLEQLEKLSISGTRLDHLPEAIGRLQRLTSLGLTGLGLTSLPDTFWLLRDIATLSLQGNHVAAELAGDGLANMPNLAVLNIAKCGLDDCPAALTRLPEIDHLDLRNNNIKTVPEALRNKEMRWIGLQGNPHSYTRADFKSEALGL